MRRCPGKGGNSTCKCPEVGTHLECLRIKRCPAGTESGEIKCMSQERFHMRWFQEENNRGRENLVIVGSNFHSAFQ